MAAKPNYPFLKLTLEEKFPRLLITRRPENKTPQQAIYGAFLPVGITRRMLDLLRRTFKLRPCELDIKGDFEAPCPEYYLQRCLAPCVERICNRDRYLETVDIVHLILSGQIEAALKQINRKINFFSDNLEFESAADWRDKRLIIEAIAKNAKWQIWVSAMNDVVSVIRENDSAAIHLTTLRRGKAVGKLFFPTNGNSTDAEIIKSFIEEFYQFYVPKQIYVSSDFPERKSLEAKLSSNFGRQIKILSKAPDKLPPSISKTNALASKVFKYEKGQSNFDEKALLKEISQIFNLRKLPERIECFDVAHLAGKEIITARVLAVGGLIQSEEGLVWEFENLSETAALAAAVGERLRILPDNKELPDLIIVDGAKPQINAAFRMLKRFDLENIPIVGAVKPPKSHNQISHFLDSKNGRYEFSQRSKAMNFLQTMRDAAHTLANATHRELHSLVQIFVNNNSAPHVKYLRVPTGFSERGEYAEDLSPIRSLTQAKEIILKTRSKTRTEE